MLPCFIGDRDPQYWVSAIECGPVSGIRPDALGGLVSPIAKLLFKTCKQGFKRTRPGHLMAWIYLANLG